MAEALDVSLEFLVGKISMEIDQLTLKRLEDISNLPDKERDTVFTVMDALLRDFKTRQAYAS